MSLEIQKTSSLSHLFIFSIRATRQNGLVINDSDMEKPEPLAVIIEEIIFIYGKEKKRE